MIWLSIGIIALTIVSILDYFKIKRLTNRITELEYKNKYRIFTGEAPVSRVSSNLVDPPY
jgi:hypothetical protein